MRFVYQKRRKLQRVYSPRSAVGVSLTELLIASLFIGLTTALIGELVVTTTLASVKCNNQSSLLGSAKVSTERLVSDIEMARSIGDYYGLSNGTSEPIDFPNPSNPLYGTTGFLSGFPGAPVLDQPFHLGSQCLILQQPIIYWAKENHPMEPTFDPNAQSSPLNGFPVRIRANAYSSGAPPVAVENLDTVIYQVVPDSRPGEFLLQVLRIPGYSDPSVNTHYEGAIYPAATVASGIIGPKPIDNPSGVPQVFRYLTRTASGIRELSTAELADDNNIKYVVGVAIDLEFKKSTISSSATDANSQNIGIHNEAFIKGNRLKLVNND